MRLHWVSSLMRRQRCARFWRSLPLSEDAAAGGLAARQRRCRRHRPARRLRVAARATGSARTSPGARLRRPGRARLLLAGRQPQRQRGRREHPADRPRRAARGGGAGIRARERFRRPPGPSAACRRAHQPDSRPRLRRDPHERRPYPDQRPCAGRHRRGTGPAGRWPPLPGAGDRHRPAHRRGPAENRRQGPRDRGHRRLFASGAATGSRPSARRSVSTAASRRAW